MDIPTTPFVTECMVIVQRVRLRAILLRESEKKHDLTFKALAATLFDGVAFKSAEAFFQAFEASLQNMPLTLKYFNSLRHYTRNILIEDMYAENRQLIEAINRGEEPIKPESRPSDFDLVRFPQRGAAFIHDAVEAPSSSCNS